MVLEILPFALTLQPVRFLRLFAFVIFQIQNSAIRLLGFFKSSFQEGMWRECAQLVFANE